jgi:hypothetical protein
MRLFYYLPIQDKHMDMFDCGDILNFNQFHIPIPMEIFKHAYLKP